MNLPADIRTQIAKQFPKETEREEVERLLLSLWTTSLNVGPAQLARSILVLSGGFVASVREIFGTHFLGDPRDVIMRAATKAGDPGNYFIEPFAEGDTA